MRDRLRRGIKNSPFAQTITEIGRYDGVSHRDVFADFLALAAHSLSNAVDRSHWNEREQAYMAIAKKYSKEQMHQFSRALGELTLAFEDNPDEDHIGKAFMSLEMGGEHNAQFFTPYEISSAMARILLSKAEIASQIEQKGYISCCEPSCGAGGMIVAIANQMHDMGINYQKHLYVEAIDVDIQCVYMSYIQMSLLGIPGLVIHGNTLEMSCWSRWYTPMFFLKGWPMKLQATQA